VSGRKSLSRVTLLSLLVLPGCGVFVPEKDVLGGDPLDQDGFSRQGTLENTLVAHIKCEIARGLWKVSRSPFANEVPWLWEAFVHRAPPAKPPVAPPAGNPPVAAPTAAPRAPAPTVSEWGTSVNLSIMVDELSGLTPGVSLRTPLENVVNTFPTGGNVVSPQSISLGLGASATAHATRTETIQFTFANPELLNQARHRFVEDPAGPAVCDKSAEGIMINSNLKIDDFIYDKATIAALGNDISTHRTWAPFSLFEDTITFVASYGGSVTPTWTFARVAVDPTSPTVSATRTKTNTLIITLGELSTKASPTSPATLSSAATAQHNNAATGAAVAGSNKAGMSGG
jgi:hypothetical protein